MSGAAEGSYGIHLNYLPYLLLHTPVLGLLKGFLLIVLICWMFPGKPTPPRTLAPIEPMSGAEKRLAWMLLVVLTLWVTESWHGVGPAWTGLVAAVITLLPRVGFINGDEFASGVNFRTCIYVAGILGLAITVTETGLGSVVGESLLKVMPLDPQRPFTSFVALTGITSAMNFIMTANGVPALFTTLAQSFSQATGFPLLSVIMIQVLGYSTPLLPYQASPIVVAMALGKVPARAGIALCLALALVTFLVLLPLDYAWFRLLHQL